MTASNNMILPNWHSVCFDYKKCTSGTITNFQLDHGEFGVDIVNVESNKKTFKSVRYGKSVKNLCSHLIVNLPTLIKTTQTKLLNVKHPSELSAEDIKLLNTILKYNKKYLEQKKVVKNFYKSKKLADKLPYSYRNAVLAAARLMKFQEKERKLNVGGCMASCRSDYYNDSFVFCAGGKKMNKLVINKVKASSLMNELNFQDCTLQSFDSRLRQIICAVIHNSVFCGIRERKSCSLLEFDAREGQTQLKCKISSEHDILDFDISPYIPGDLVYTNEFGSVFLETANNTRIWSINLDEENSSNTPHAWFGCKFNSHPRCLLGVSSKKVSIYDIRSSCERVLEAFSLPSVFLPIDEQIHNVFNYSGNEHMKFIVTSQTVLLLDERFLKQPILKWSHNVSCSPTLGSITECPTWNHVIAVGSSTRQDSSVIHFLQDSRQKLNIYSRCPSMKASKPQDVIEELIRKGYYKAQTWLKRISSPFVGLCILPSVSSEQIYLLHLTRAGDLFAQTLKSDFQENNEPNIRVNINTSGSSAEETSRHLKELKKWNQHFRLQHENPVYSNKDYPPNNFKHATKMIKVLSKDHHASKACLFCSGQSSAPVCDEICLSCGVNTQISQRMKKAFDKGEVISDSLLDKPTSLNILCMYGLEEKNWAEFNDKTSRKIMNAWNRNDNAHLEYNESSASDDEDSPNHDFFDDSVSHTHSSERILRSLNVMEEDIIPSSQPNVVPVERLVKKITMNTLRPQINAGF